MFFKRLVDIILTHLTIMTSKMELTYFWAFLGEHFYKKFIQLN